jgi:predicted transcriptional regulator
MPKRRSKDQIIAQILATCQEESVNKTKVVYQASLNFRTVVPYLDQLITKDLLEVSADKHPLYRTTAKGKKALKSLRVIEEIYF